MTVFDKQFARFSKLESPPISNGMVWTPPLRLKPCPSPSSLFATAQGLGMDDSLEEELQCLIESGVSSWDLTGVMEAGNC